MKKILSLICVACLSMSIVSCGNKELVKNTEDKAAIGISITEKEGTEKLKPLELVGPSTGYNLSNFVLDCSLPQAPEKVEFFEPINMKEAEGSINYRATEEKSYANEEPIDFDKAAQVAKDFLKGKGVKLSDEKLTVKETESRTPIGGKTDVLLVSTFAPRKINGLRLYDGDIVVRVLKGYKIVGYKNTEFDLSSKGYYKIISPKEAVDSLPKFSQLIWGEVFSDNGYITNIELCYYGLTQKNIQPVYAISGYTDKDKKDHTFRVIIPAVR